MTMNKPTKKALLDYLFSYVTEHKQALMQRIVQERTRYLTVVLEDIYQPHNASACIRSAEVFGVQAVHAIEQGNRFTPEGGVAMGSSKWVTLERHRSVAACYQQLKDEGYSIVATSPGKDAVPLHELSLDTKTAIVFGTEETGLTQEAFEGADVLMTIPMYGFTESFNVSVSVALTLYDLTTRLRASSIDWHLTDDEQLDVLLAWARNAVRAAPQLEKKFFDGQT